MSSISTLSGYARDLSQAISRCSKDAQGLSDDEFNRLALGLFDLQIRRNPVYRRFCELEGRLTACDWREIPALPVVAFKELEVSALEVSERVTHFQSSGTTGQKRSRHFHSTESLSLYATSVWQGFRNEVPCFENGFGLSLTPPPVAVTHSSLVHMFEVIQKRGSFAGFEFAGRVNNAGDWIIDGKIVREAVRRATANSMPVILFGTAFSYVHLLDALLENDVPLPLPANSLVFETGGYKGRSRTIPQPELHTMISSAFGVRHDQIICEYGMGELSSQAYGRPGQTGLPTPPCEAVDPSMGRPVFRFPPWARARVLSAENRRPVAPGDVGLLCIVDLANVWSVQAIQTEDLAVSVPGGFVLEGRVSDAAPRGCSLMTAS